MTILTYQQPKSDFEKLLYCERYIRELKILAGKDQAYIQELEAQLHNSLTPAEKMEIKRGEYYENLKNQLKEKCKKIEHLSKQNKLLTNEIIKLKLQQ